MPVRWSSIKVSKSMLYASSYLVPSDGYHCVPPIMHHPTNRATLIQQIIPRVSMGPSQVIYQLRRVVTCRFIAVSLLMLFSCGWIVRLVCCFVLTEQLPWLGIMMYPWLESVKVYIVLLVCMIWHILVSNISCLDVNLFRVSPRLVCWDTDAVSDRGVVPNETCL